MKVAYKIETGMIRTKNEDYCLIDEEKGLFIVADGVGGHKHGELASLLATTMIYNYICDNSLDFSTSDISKDIIKQHIITAVNKAHYGILKEVDEKGPEYKGMATTVVLAVCRKDALLVAHVGDSRAYLLDKADITPLTTDHSLVNKLISSGTIKPEDAKNHKFRHIITQCLGCSEYHGPDVSLYNWDAGKLLLLCSDGLTDMLQDNEIHKIIRKKIKKPHKVADKLIKKANKAGGKDNITFILAYNG